MAIYKRGNVYWFTFVFDGVRYQRSTKQRDRKAARQMESAFRTALAKGELGISERRRIPTLKEFAQQFINAIQVRCAAKPATIEFYAKKLTRLLEYGAVANARLDKI